MTIQDQEFGELVGLIKALKESSMERHLETHEALKAIGKRIDDHMTEEEEDRKGFLARLEKIETIFKFLKWLTPIGLILWPILVPMLQKILLSVIFPNVNLEALLSFTPVIHYL